MRSETIAFEANSPGDFIGEVSHRLTLDMVRTFLVATGCAEQHLPPGAIAPSGLLTLLSTAAFREITGRRSGDIHARHRYEHFTPLYVGEIVRTTSHLVNKFEKRDRKYLVYTSQTEEINTRRLVARCYVTLAVVS